MHLLSETLSTFIKIPLKFCPSVFQTYFCVTQLLPVTSIISKMSRDTVHRFPSTILCMYFTCTTTSIYTLGDPVLSPIFTGGSTMNEEDSHRSSLTTKTSRLLTSVSSVIRFYLISLYSNIFSHAALQSLID